MNSKEKRKFRQSKEWKEFRQKIINNRGRRCECCGGYCSKPQLHHIDESDYTNLDPKKFVLLCSLCHKQISRLERAKRENWEKLFNQEFINYYSKFLIDMEIKNLY